LEHLAKAGNNPTAKIPVDMDEAKPSTVMRPSPTLNASIDAIA